MTEFIAHAIRTPQRCILASNEKYFYTSTRVPIHRSHSLLQLSDTTVKTSDGVVLAVISYCTPLLHGGQITSFGIGICGSVLIVRLSFLDDASSDWTTVFLDDWWTEQRIGLQNFASFLSSRQDTVLPGCSCYHWPFRYASVVRSVWRLSVMRWQRPWHVPWTLLQTDGCSLTDSFTHCSH